MTTHDTSHGQPQTLERTVLLQGLDGIVGARRMEAAARWHKGTGEQLVGTHQPDQRFGQRGTQVACPASSRSSSMPISDRHALRVAGSCPETGVINLSTRSSAGNPDRRRRNASRACRLIALRRTAVDACFFGITRPRRAVGKPLARTCRAKCVPRNTRRAAKTSENSAGFTSLNRRPKRSGSAVPERLKQKFRRRDGDVPWHDGHAARHGRRGYGNERGNHGCACAAQRMVGRYVSCRESLKEKRAITTC